MYSSFCFPQLIVLSRSPCPPPRKYRTYCRSERDINKHTAQRRAISSAIQQLLALLSIRYSHEIIKGLFFLPHLFFSHVSVSCILSCASVAGGVSSLAERSPVLSLEPHRLPPGTVGTRVYSSFCFFVVGFVLHLGPLRDFFLASYTRTTADQNVTSPAYSTAQTGQSAPHN